MLSTTTHEILRIKKHAGNIIISIGPREIPTNNRDVNEALIKNEFWKFQHSRWLLSIALTPPIHHGIFHQHIIPTKGKETKDFWPDNLQFKFTVKVKKSSNQYSLENAWLQKELLWWKRDKQCILQKTKQKRIKTNNYCCSPIPSGIMQ